jgi:putative membrane protein
MEGEVPDYRFTLANERTMLAWIRTSLALLAGGIAISQFVEGFTLLRHLMGMGLILLAGSLAALAFRQWERNERAMWKNQRLPLSPVPAVVGSVLTLVIAVAAVFVLVSLFRG